MHVVVFGGTGFLGTHIVRAILMRGHAVSVITRGNPSKHAAGGAEYVNADIFDPSTYSSVLSKADAVVHSVGAIMDNPAYKKLAGEPLCPSTVLKLVEARFTGRNPLSGSSFRRLNYESAVLAAAETNELAKAQDRMTRFVYISAENWNKLADPEYISSKRLAEQKIGSLEYLRPVYFRPGFLYDKNASRLEWPSLKSSISAGLGLYDTVFGNAPRTSVQLLSQAVAESIDDPDISGVVSNAALRQYSSMVGGEEPI